MDLLDEPGAEERLLHFVNEGVNTGNRQLEAEARVVLGIFWQHQEQSAKARRELEQALGLGLTSEDDRKCVEMYLKAIRMGYPGGSFVEGALVARSIRNYVTARLPDGMISDLRINVDEQGAVRTEVEVDRDLSDEELAQVNRTIEEAVRVHDGSDGSGGKAA